MNIIIIIWPFRSQFGLKLRGGGEPSPLDPLLMLHWVNYYLVDKCYKTNCVVQWIVVYAVDGVIHLTCSLS